jgi:uncharacterized protein YceH (UPF0502 family)
LYAELPQRAIVNPQRGFTSVVCAGRKTPEEKDEMETRVSQLKARVFKLETHVSKLETHVSKLETHVSR